MQQPQPCCSVTRRGLLKHPDWALPTLCLTAGYANANEFNARICGSWVRAEPIALDLKVIFKDRFWQNVSFITDYRV
ncbi:MAG: hypothetical protein HC778_03260 [Chamaesiphon sp. CSU_1_12]|nr:hypothetical protein [Chamaesiphon sp. CSU_1_12]